MNDPKPQFAYFIEQLKAPHPSLAYVHLVEPARGPSIVPNGPRHGEGDPAELLKESNDFIRKIWAPRPLISCTENTRETALEVAEKKGDIIGFGRLFISNVSLQVLVPPATTEFELSLLLARPALPLAT